ncbi:P-loop containing nucleoside triphosphate hydrolase protein [Apiosordaria backusii]|uniref:P-loop containing nucleoside triphosphate hydrolase protein n=1 Tax=Apiosordaria backusii TaxID=314023 RepID=A0AA40AEF9_9PEZI|nr:P-loop containing nucleoside triphosphate hydrolase protein [Apiosordaria backusii]
MPSRTINNLGAESSRKRHHLGEDEAEEAVRPRSHLNVESRKRVRLSDVRDETPAVDPEDEEEYHAPASPDTPPRTQYELMRDNGFEHLRNEVADDQRATQRLGARVRPNLLGENVVAENGILERVECINFMCHTRLVCDLGPLLNFIVGENGSGKSAILTAITLCLGGKASSTNRGGSLKAFVKEGAERAVLIVKIKNQGVDAFKPEVYGDSIIVERHFSKSGSSGFKIKTVTGAIHSTKKQEVDEIVEYYALQVDNPLNVLSQDNARQFLNASTKAQKYKFFIEGVQLQQLDNDYRLIAESLSQMEAKVPDQEQRVELAKAERAKAERLLETLEGERAMRDKINRLRLKVAWSRMDTCEKKLVQKQAALAEATAALIPAEQAMNEKSEAYERAKAQDEAAVANLERIKEEEPELQSRVEEAREYNRAMVAALMKVQAEEREAHTNWKTYSDQVKLFEQKITDEEKSLQEAHGGAQTQKLKEKDEALAKVKEIQQKIEDNMKLVPQIVSQVDDSAKALTQVKDQVTKKQLEITNIQKEIETIQKDLGGPLDGYERSMPKLVTAIEDDKRFQQKPIGPLGTLVHLHKPEWAGILESFFGNNLNGFLVFNKSDMNILSDLMKRCNIDSKNSPVFIGQRNPLNLAGKEPDAEYDTILRILKIDNQAVRDTLVINNMIEQVLLIPKRTTAQNVMFDGAPPRNVKMCLCFNDSRNSKNAGFRLTNSGSSLQTNPVNNRREQKRLKTESGSQIAFLKQSLTKLESELQALGVEYRRVQQENTRHKAELAKAQKEGTNLKKQLDQTHEHIARIEIALDEWDGSDARLQSLREQLAQAKEQKAHHGEQVTGLVLAKDQKNLIAEEAKKKLQAEKLQLKDFEARLKKAEEKVKSKHSTHTIDLTAKNESVAEYNALKEKQKAIEESIERERERIAAAEAEGKSVCEERVHLLEGETEASVNATYYALHDRYKKMIKTRRMDEQQVHAAVIKARETYDRAVNGLNSMMELNERLKHTLSLRLDKWRKFQRYISSQSRANFIYLLSERGFRGKLLLDHERRALDLQVEPDKTEKRANGRSTKTLSGGEKSFASICLLLAIWEAMGSPLRCLDEFDVFMDNVNRAISTNMLITAARRSVNRQYIFITPNAIEGRNALEADVKIIRLTDPRQRQITSM